MFVARAVFLLYYLLAFTFLQFSPAISVAAKYSYRNSEKLKHLIKWRNYGADAFKEAQKDNKPIFLLVSAPSWCYFCRVYESRNYLFNDRIYPYINKHFIPIYVDDSEKMHFIVRKYLQGGWPSTIILLPDGKKFIGWAGVLSVKDLYDILQKAVKQADVGK